MALPDDLDAVHDCGPDGLVRLVRNGGRWLVYNRTFFNVFSWENKAPGSISPTTRSRVGARGGVVFSVEVRKARSWENLIPTMKARRRERSSLIRAAIPKCISLDA